MSFRYVIANFLPQDIYDELEQLVTGQTFEWYLKTGTVEGQQTNFGVWRYLHVL